MDPGVYFLALRSAPGIECCCIYINTPISAADSERILVDKQLGSLRKAVEELNAQIAVQVAYRNTLATINRLPDIILYTIFSCFQEKYRARPRKSLEWIRVTHVCEHWRSVALDHAVLWTYIPLHRERWIPEFIKRSKSALLTFEVQEDDVNFASLENLMRQHVSRLQALKIHRGVTDKKLQELFSDLPAGSATQLQSLQLPDDMESCTAIASIRRCLGRISSLRELDVAWSLDWSSGIFTGLTRLTLSSQKPRHPNNPHLPHHFLGALRRMPFLRVLHLGGDRLPIPESSVSDPVNLPYLQSLHLSDSSARLCSALRCITFPGTVQARLYFKIVQFAEVNEIVKRLAAFKSPDRPAIRNLKVKWEERRMQLTGWTGSPDEEMFGPKFDEEDCYFQVTVSCSIQFRPREEQKQAILIAISCITSPAPPLTVLFLSAFEPIFDLNEYFRVLGRQPELHTIFVKGTIFWPLLQSITLMSSPKENPPNYPALRHLNVCGVFFYPKGQRRPFEDLQEILEVRKKYGMKLHSIDFMECQSISRGNIAALEKIVDKVTWDELEIGLSEGYEDEEDFEDDDSD